MAGEIQIYIDGQEVDVDSENTNVHISDMQDVGDSFQTKAGSQAYDIELPGTVHNSKVFNSFENPSAEDLSLDIFSGVRSGLIKASGDEIISGKALLESAFHTDKPIKYNINIFGGNSDWSIPLQDKKLKDFVNPRKIEITDDTVLESLDFNGRSEEFDYVFSPVRYSYEFKDENDEYNAIIKHLRPHISIYWVLWRMFKSQGYRIVSNFLDSDYFRRLVLLWTWGNFFTLDDKKYDVLKFRAGTPDTVGDDGYIKIQAYEDTGSVSEVADLQVTDDSSGYHFDNSDSYEWNSSSKTMSWTYDGFDFGTLTIDFRLRLLYKMAFITMGTVKAKARFYRNGNLIFENVIIDSTKDAYGFVVDKTFSIDDVAFGDVIECDVFVEIFPSNVSGYTSVSLKCESFSNETVYLPVNSYRSISDYEKLNNYKVLDLLRGVIDLFDLQIKTDPVKKEVYIEPYGDYFIGEALHKGFNDGSELDWTDKQDLSKESEMTLYSDMERDYEFVFKDDGADGGLKAVQDRNVTTVGKAVYVFPERFKAEKKTYTNRFFSPTMHIEETAWSGITGIAPQLPCIISNDISSASSLYSENTYEPKIAYYKGKVSGVGGWRYKRTTGEIETYSTLPYTFAVNYRENGEYDPVLSYSDQLVNGKIARGLLSNFFLKRMAIMRYGRRYTTYIKLNNTDMRNFVHKEFILINGIKFQYIGIEDYDPKSDDSTKVTLWKMVEKTQEDTDRTRPTRDCILSSKTTQKEMDFLYWRHIVLPSDAIIRD